jgi:F0F1-type ATP synthase assembly protein I
MKTSAWAEQKIKILESKIQEIDPSDFRFYNIAHIPIIAKQTDAFSSTCEKCAENRAIIDNLLDHLQDSLSDDADKRKTFDINKSSIEAHLKKEHNCHFPGYYTALWSLIGLIGGFLTAASISYFTNQSIFNKLSLMALAVFLMLGRGIGVLTDRKVFRNNLQL